MGSKILLTSSFILFCTMAVAAAEFQMASPSFGNCEILFPNQLDKNERYCNKSYGVTYNGHKIDESCYENLTDAVNSMNATPACLKSDRLDNCKLLYPNELDNNERYCNKSFAVTYEGFKVDTLCYPDLQSAQNAMDNTLACSKNKTIGFCSILFPNRLDINQRYCNKSFGVTYDGSKIDRLCHATLDAAFTSMESTPICKK